MLIILLLVSFTSLSQVDMKNKDTLICFPKSIVIKIQKDLLKKDFQDSVIADYNHTFNLLNTKISYKDSIINNNNAVISMYKKTETDYKKIIGLREEQISDLNNEVSKQKRHKKIAIGAGIGLFILGILLVNNG